MTDRLDEADGAFQLLETLLRGRSGGAPEQDLPDRCRLALMLHKREKQGETTQLRDLHALLRWPQQRAFGLVRSLQEDGLVVLGTSLHDAFASTVSLEPGLAETIAAMQER